MLQNVKEKKLPLHYSAGHVSESDYHLTVLHEKIGERWSFFSQNNGGSYDVSACDGGALSCDRHRKTSWRQKKWEHNRYDNIHIRVKIPTRVTNCKTLKT